jgi:hypothetical protein
MTTGKEIPYMTRLRQELTNAIADRERQHERRRMGLPPRRPALIVAFAAGVLAVGVLAMVMLFGGDEARGPGPRAVATDPTTQPTVIDPGQGSCVEAFTPETLAEREIAFDGTVVATGPGEYNGNPLTEVTFRVNRWFKGGDGARVTLMTYSTPGAITSVDGGLSLEKGSRLLVSGDGGFIWECGGFSQPYSEEGALLFAEAFGD